MPRTIAYRLYVDWDFNGVYTDESAYLVQATGDLSLSPPADFLTSGRGIVDRCRLELRNASGRFSALNSSSPLYTYIQSGKAYHAPMYLEVSINGGSNYYRVFTGVAKIPQESGMTTREGPMVVIECRSRDELLLQLRQSTTLANFQAWHDGGYTEGQIINAMLTAAGITTGTSVDAGLIRMDWAWLDDESVLEELWALAAACGGRFYTDPDGTMRYENATHWLAHSSSLETLTKADYDAGLEIAYTDDDLYNVVTVEASSRVAAPEDVLWEAEEEVMIPPSGSKALVARLRQPAYTAAVSYTAAAAGGENLASYISVSATYYAQRVEMTITNSNAYWAAYMRPLQVVGRPVQGGPTQEESRDSATHGSNGAFFTTRGGRTRSLRSNPYVQSRAQAGMLALFLLHQSEYPRLTYRLRGVLGNPARRLGDRVTINDTSVMSASRDAFLVGIRWRLTANGFQQDLEAIDAAQLYPYQSDGYFIIGTNVLSATSKRIFY